jgi:hypothetical protein
MKISPLASSQAGSPGQVLGTIEVGGTSEKRERAKALLRGETPREQTDHQADRIQQNVRRITMRTQQSTNRDDEMDALVAAEAAAATKDPASSNQASNEQATIEDTKPLSPQFAALARQKRALQVKERELLEKEKALGSPVKDGAPDLMARLKSQPLSVLQEAGVTYDQLTEAILSGQGVNPEIQALKEELKSLKKGVDETFQTKEEQAEQSALTEMSFEIDDLAKEGDAFECIRAEGDSAVEAVLRHIYKTYKATGRVPDVRTSMEKVENDLLVKAEKFAGINKLRAKIAPAETATLQPQQRGMRTLTARDTAIPNMGRRARAIAAAMGKLQK